jgi:hypothetical protein
MAITIIRATFICTRVCKMRLTFTRPNRANQSAFLPSSRGTWFRGACVPAGVRLATPVEWLWWQRLGV